MHGTCFPVRRIFEALQKRGRPNLPAIAIVGRERLECGLRVLMMSLRGPWWRDGGAFGYGRRSSLMSSSF